MKKNDESRFWSKVSKTQTCWLWTDSKHTQGYGFFLSNKKQWKAHRYSWLLAHGQIPKGMCVLHKCDNRMCVRPSHLFLGSKRDNNLDAIRKGRYRSGKSILNVEGVKRLRREYQEFIREKAKELRVSQKATRAVIAGKSWKSLINDPYKA